MKYSRATNQYRKAEERLNDWNEVYNHRGVMEGLRVQAARFGLEKIVLHDQRNDETLFKSFVNRTFL